MTRKRVSDNKVTEVSPEIPVNTVVKTSHPLVFISHDTRDAELAEEFGSLLHKASAGGLKTFRSSDKKGTQGIEYGLEWYPAIMAKIDEASEVVCLLTQRSIDRPWILYEAGVAKGKLDKKVIGIAIGIAGSAAFTGPFAQFQNNDGSIESIAKLVLDLVRKVSGLDPDQQHVLQLVEAFHKKAIEIAERTNRKTENPAEESENFVAKLFEEVKIMFDSLPSRIENKIDPEYRRRKRKMHPMMFEEFTHLGSMPEDANFGFLIMLSLYKDDFPWFYEIGMETYRGLKSAKTAVEKDKLIMNFDRAVEMLGHPMMRELFGESKESYMLYKEARHFMRRYSERLFEDKKIKE